MNDPQQVPVTQTAPETLISYSLHDRIVKGLEAKLYDAVLDRERAREQRKYAPPMTVKIDASNWEDGEHVIIIDGCPVGGSVSPATSKAIVAWLHTAWAELIEHNTMKHRSSAKSNLIAHNGIFAADMDDLHTIKTNTRGAST